MENFKAKFKTWYKTKGWAVLLTTIFFTIILLDKYFLGSYLLTTVYTFDALVAIIGILIMMLAVGSTVVKSLIHISAGLSLIIFLAQSYCSVPNHTLSGDNALKFLLFISLTYLIYDFFEIFIKEISSHLSIFKKVKWEMFWKFILGALSILIIFVFLWNIYQVISPIIKNLCVFS